MNVLLLCSIPDPREHPEWAKDLDVIAIREAVRALAAVAMAGDASVVMLAQPAVEALMNVILPPGRVLVVDEDGMREAFSEAVDAVLIGGTDRELALAKAARTAGVMVFPIGSTGGAAEAACDEAFSDTRWGLEPEDLIVLSQSTVYAHVFEGVLSL